MDSMDYASEMLLPVKDQVIREIEALPPESRVKIYSDFADLPLKKPDAQGLMAKYDDNDVKQVIKEGFSVLNAPIVDYPQAGKGDVPYDRVDQVILKHFESDQEKRQTAEEILLNNRMRVNKLTNTLQALSLIPVILEEPQKVEDIQKVMQELTGTKGVNRYKSLSLEQKRGVVKKFSKGMEMALRVLDGQELNEKDWETLKRLA